MKNMKVVGGQRKVDAVEHIAAASHKNLSDMVVVGDSITDFKMLDRIHKEGGLAIVFNGNEYAIPYGTVGLASSSLADLMFIIDHWERHEKKGVVDAIKNWEKEQFELPSGGGYQLLEGQKNYEHIIEIHKKYRSIVRGRAAKLG
jgi:energy-converting hydrogenase A subunit R